TGQHLDTVLRKALAVRRRVRKETPLGSHFVSPAHAAVRLADQIFGSVASRNIVVLGAGRVAEATVRAFLAEGAPVCLINRSRDRAQELAHRIAGSAGVLKATAFEEREEHLATADLVISATAAPRFCFSAQDMKRLAAKRQGRKLVLIDLALPRDIDPAVREFDGVLLYDLEDLERAVEPRIGTRAGEAEAEKIVLAEVQGFRKQIIAGGAGPELTALWM